MLWGLLGGRSGASTPACPRPPTSSRGTAVALGPQRPAATSPLVCCPWTFLAWTFLDFLDSRLALVPGSLVPIVSCPVRRESSLLLSSSFFFSLLLLLSISFCFLLSVFYFLLSAFLFSFWLVRLRRLGGDDFSASPFASSRVRKRLPRLDPSARLAPTGRSLFPETDRGIRRPLDLPSPTGNWHSERRPSRRIHGRWERDLSPLVVDRRTKPRVGRSLQRRN